MVSRDLRQSRTIVVATFRDREAKPEPAVVEGLRAICREGSPLGLPRLGVDDVAVLLAARAGREVPRTLALRIQATTDGNPLFVDEVCRLLVARRGLDAPVGELPIPTGIRDAIRERLAALDPDGRSLLEAGAVLGRDFTVELASALLEVGHSEIVERTRKGIDAGLLQELGVGHYEIRHALFREAVYRDLDADRRAMLHARAAEVFERTTAAERALGEVAQHLLAAVSVVGVKRAYDGCLRAAQRALDALAFEDASSILATALSEIGSSVGDGERAALFVLLGEARARGGEPEEARKACEEAAKIARSSADGELLARAALSLGAEIMPGVLSAPLIALLTEARDALPDTSSKLRARVLARLAAALQPAQDPKVPMSMARQAVAMARALGDEATLRVVLHHAGSALVDFGDPAERIGWDTELLTLAERNSDTLGVLRARVRLFFDHLERGETSQADFQLDAHAEIADRLGLPDHQWRTLTMRALRAISDGRFDDAETRRAQARRIAVRSRIPEALTVEPLQQQGLLLARGDGLAGIDEVLERMRGFPSAHEMELILRAFVAYQQDDLDGATRLLAQMSGETYIWSVADPGMRFLVEIVAWNGNREIAERLYATVTPYAKRMMSWGRIAMVMEGPVAWLLGSLATTLGRYDEADEWFEGALSAARAAGTKPYEAITCAEYARLLRVRGSDPKKLERIANHGIAIARSIGAEGTARRISKNAGLEEHAVPAPASQRAQETASAIELVRDGEFWALRSRGRTVRLKDSRGVQLLAELIANPGHEFHVLTLAGSEGADPGDAGEVLDQRAQKAYRERADDLREQIREAESFGDAGRLSRLRAELDRLGEELASAVGLGGRNRRAGAAAERARVNVQKRLRDAIRRIAEVDAGIGRQLERAVRTGTFCAYEP
jgi:tetratricopeptide (TPR) repeat protein